MKNKILIALVATLPVIITSCLKNQFDEAQKQEIIDRTNYLTDLKASLNSAKSDHTNYPRLDPTIYTDSVYGANYKYYYYYVRMDTGITTSGAKPLDNEFVYVDITGSLVNGTVFYTSNHTTATRNGIAATDINSPYHIIQVDSFLVGGLNLGLLKMKKGQTYKFVIPSELALGIYSTNLIPSFSTLIYDVKLVKVVKNMQKYDDSIVKSWVDSLKLSLIQGDDTSKIYCKLDSASSGDSLVDGNQVRVVYKGKILDYNKYFTDSTKYDSITFTMGQNQINNKGWELALHHLKDSSKAELVVPYNMAYKYGYYNNAGQTVIPEYHSLYYELHKIIRIKK